MPHHSLVGTAKVLYNHGRFLIFAFSAKRSFVRRYRTQILIPPDRTVVMQLPSTIPDGWAIVTIQVQENHEAEHHEADPDHQDIEWWDEFDDEEELLHDQKP